MRVRLEQKHGEWTRDNPILLQGEPGLEHITNRLKVGNGKTRWSDLPYVSAMHSELDATVTALVAEQTARLSSEGIDTARDAAETSARISADNAEVTARNAAIAAQAVTDIAAAAGTSVAMALVF